MSMMTSEAPREVLLIDANRAMRTGMELLFRSWGHHVVGRAGDIQHGLELIRSRRPSVTLVDFDLAGQSGAEFARLALREDPAARIVLYIGEPSRLDLDEAMRCGAQGAVMKSDDPQALRQAIEGVAAGEQHLSPSVRHELAAADGRVLSKREREVLQLLSEGLNGRQASRVLTLAPDTVRTHVRNAARKLGAKTRVHAVTMAVKQLEIAGSG
jgi:DNA-binding NarL/FixJ family response regulator